jgi:predicted helicase
VTDEVLASYQTAFGVGVTKDDIFFYLYGLLHSPNYRANFEPDLKKTLPRIPKIKNFHLFSDAGRKLSELHLGYETVEPYPLTEKRGTSSSYRVEKMRYAKSGRTADKSTVIYNSSITVYGIPAEAHEYMLGSRSAID